MLTFVGSACGGALLQRRRRNFMTSRELSFSTSWTGDRLDVFAQELLSRVMGVASRSRSALPLSEVTLEHEADLPVCFLPAPRSIRVLDFEGLRLVIDAFCCGMFGRTVFVSESVASLGCIGVHFPKNGLRASVQRHRSVPVEKTEFGWRGSYQGAREASPELCCCLHRS